MKHIVGTKSEFSFIVTDNMSATFDGELIHLVLSTFWLSYYFEWYSRKMIDRHFKSQENACGSELSIKHISPAFIGEKVTIEVLVISVDESKVTCKLEAFVDQRKIATGKTVQFVSTNQFFKEKFKPKEKS